jgi:hypothetical protein
MSATVSEPYRSLPLHHNSKHIRLLAIHAPTNPDNDSEPVLATIFVADLDDSPSFSALSYTWGPPALATESKTIRCCDTDIRITDNCYAAIVDLRRKLSTFMIWIDAICINQRDDVEKAHQISLMKDIYPRAQPVYVWLGEGDATTDQSMQYLSQLGFLDCFFRYSDLEAEGRELSRPLAWTAARRAFFSFWGSKRTVFPQGITHSPEINV